MKWPLLNFTLEGKKMFRYTMLEKGRVQLILGDHLARGARILCYGQGFDLRANLRKFSQYLLTQTGVRY